MAEQSPGYAGEERGDRIVQVEHPMSIGRQEVKLESEPGGVQASFWALCRGGHASVPRSRWWRKSSGSIRSWRPTWRTGSAPTLDLPVDRVAGDVRDAGGIGRRE
jgi:hypothetical protein